MLIIPLASKLDWRRPPLITLLLVLANLLVYALTENRDEQSLERAVRYFLHSPLAQIEPMRYLRYLHDQGEVEEERDLRKALGQGENGMVEVLAAMQGDQDFLSLLHAGRIVTPSDPRYAEWRNARGEFDRLWQERVAYRYGFVPVRHDALSFVTCQFLHGSWEHVVGNMVVLFVVGFMVEAAFGWWRFLAGYLLTGVVAAAVFWAAYPHSSTPLIGASGAVSGVVGMYTGIFGLRRINFFYFVLVYFDYVKAPALIVLALWVGNEALQLFTDSESHVAYVAHIGGLVSGALLIGVARLLHTARLARFLAEVDADSGAKAQYQRALTLAGELRFDAACDILDRLVDSHPDDLELVLQNYNVARHAPASPAYHRAAGRVFALPAGNRAMAEIIATTFGDYLTTAKPSAAISPRVAVELARKFADRGRMVEGERLAGWLVERAQDSDDVAAALLFVAGGHRDAANHERAQHWLRYIVKHFPNSPAAQRVPSSTAAR
jgi:membrane associated rhomboid family serine protease